jgi:anti-sigma regulatory factor (Ser/Thr protein kinase)
MARKSRENRALRDFIVAQIGDHPRDIAAVVAHEFGVDRVTVNRYLRKLVNEGMLTAAGATKARKYAVRDYVHETIHLPVDSTSEEHVIWRERVAPLITDIPDNIREICEYGTQEMINNVIDHSGSPAFNIVVYENIHRVRIDILDDGVGIFEHIRQSCNLPDPRLALLELSKGKLTTDPQKHSGEGVFFTSRMFDDFRLLSGHLFYGRTMLEGDEWLTEVETRMALQRGTLVQLDISRASTHTVQETFKKYEDDDARFTKTHVPVKLARYGNEQLVSRSQARRVLARFENFEEVMLDFKDVESIGQAFADEIFRVFQREHPATRIIPVFTSEQVQSMISHVMASNTPAAA